MLRARMATALYTLQAIEREFGPYTPVKVGSAKVAFTSVKKRIEEIKAEAKKQGLELK